MLCNVKKRIRKFAYPKYMYTLKPEFNCYILMSGKVDI